MKTKAITRRRSSGAKPVDPARVKEVLTAGSKGSGATSPSAQNTRISITNTQTHARGSTITQQRVKVR